jgi:hypothetical protein
MQLHLTAALVQQSDHTHHTQCGIFATMVALAIPVAGVKLEEAGLTQIAG